MIASIIDDSRCGMSDVAFRTVPPIVGLSCYLRISMVVIIHSGQKISFPRNVAPS